MQALKQLRRSYSIGLGIFSLALPFFVLSMDTSAAAPKGPPTTTGASEPTTSMSDSDNSPEAKEARQRKNCKLNYISASWAKVLQDFAEATQTELVADRVPSKKFSRWDMKFYTRDEALGILNQELQPLNFRLQIKGHYLVLNALHEFRHEYPAAVLRGSQSGSNVPEDESGDQTADTEMTDKRPTSPVRTALHEGPRPERTAKGRTAPRGKMIQQASGEDEQRPVATHDPAVGPAAPIVTMVRIQERDAITVLKIIYKAFKSEAELIEDGPRGLQGFLVRQPESRKGVREESGETRVRFAIGIDEKKNRLAIEATPADTKAILQLVEAVATVPANRQSTVRAVATKKNPAKLAAALQPELNRLSKATRRLAQQDAEQNAAEEDQEAAQEETPKTQQRVLPLRPGLRRGDTRGEPDAAPPASVPRALSKSIRGDVKVESIPDLGVLVLTGNEQDVQAVMEVIQEIERLSAATAPEVQVAFLRHVSSEALATLLTSVYERLGQVRNATVQQSQAITVFPVSRPNAILIVASKADMPAVYNLIDELDEPSDPASEFHYYRLKNAVPAQVVEKVQALYPPQTQAAGAGAAAQAGAVGLVPRVRIIDDLRTNSVIVQARPRDMKEVLLLIAELDDVDIESQNEVRFFQLKNAVADEVAATVSQAIQNVLAPSRAVQAQAQGQVPGQANAAQQANANQGSAELKEVKSTILTFLDEDDPGREIRSGILADIRMTADLRTNTVVVTAPKESMELVARLINKLDRPAAQTAEIKVFKVKNGDATAMQTVLERLFGIQRTGQQGGQQGQQGQQGVPGLLVEGAEDSSSMLIPLRFSVDIRTNSIIAIGGGAALNVVEAVVLTLDESNVQQRQTDVYRLKNAPAANVATAITNFMTSQRQALTAADPNLVSPFEQIEQEVVVVAETTTNQLLISASPRYFKKIYDMVVKLDRSPKQVLIQALIVEVTLSNTDEWGMELGLQDSILFRRSPLTASPIFQTITNTSPNGVATSTQNILSESAVPGFLFNGQPLGNNTGVGAHSVAGQAGSGFNTGLTNSTLGYGGLVLQAGSENVNVLLRALSARTRVDVLSRPQIRTVDNMIGSIQVGQEIPRVNGFTANGTTGVNTPVIQQRPIGIILQVIPRVSLDGVVIMEVVARRDSLSQQSVALVSGVGGTVNSPIINTTNAQATVAVTTGQTVILGGMITKQDNLEERKVPLIGDIPILGQAFRYDLKTTTRTELLIFLTPRIINSDEEAEMFKQIEAERLNFIESEAERMHGPLFGMPLAPSHGAVPAPKGTPAPLETPQKTRSAVPPPPEADIPGALYQRREPSRITDSVEDDGAEASLMRNDDEEDLEAAFIQTSYQKSAASPGRARLGKVEAKTTPVAKAGKKGVAGAVRPKPTQGGDRPSQVRRTDSDDSKQVLP